MEKLITVLDPYTLNEKVAPNTSYPIEQFLEERVQEGWRPLVRQLVLDLFDLGWDGRVSQVKEKLGGFVLNFPMDSYPISDDIFNRYYRAHEDSYRTCELCGNPGFLCRSGTGWLKTLCTSHLENRSGSFERISTTTNEEGARKQHGSAKATDKQR